MDAPRVWTCKWCNGCYLAHDVAQAPNDCGFIACPKCGNEICWHCGEKVERHGADGHRSRCRPPPAEVQSDSAPAPATAPAGGPEMISLKTIQGRVVPYTISNNPDVKVVREFASSRFEYPQDRFYLIGGAKILQDGRGIKDYGIRSGATVQVVYRQRGGDCQ
jgi:hypothetical protein